MWFIPETLKLHNCKHINAGSILHPSFFCLNQIELVDAFVGMTLSPDGESVEVSTLISRDSQEDLSDLMSLFHAIMAVLGGFHLLYLIITELKSQMTC